MCCVLPPVDAAEPLRDDPLASSIARHLEQPIPFADEVPDAEAARTRCRFEGRAPAGLPLLNGAAAKVMAIEVKKIEGEVGEAVAPRAISSCKSPMCVAPFSSGTAISPSSTSSQPSARCRRTERETALSGCDRCG
jgi:hypothetical protein